MSYSRSNFGFWLFVVALAGAGYYFRAQLSSWLKGGAAAVKPPATTPVPSSATGAPTSVIANTLNGAPGSSSGSPVVSVFAADASEQPQNEIALYDSITDPRYAPTSQYFLGNGSNRDADVEAAFAGAGTDGRRVLGPISFGYPFGINNEPTEFAIGHHHGEF